VQKGKKGDQTDWREQAHHQLDKPVGTGSSSLLCRISRTVPGGGKVGDFHA
jgi:hypothetical protein